MPQSQPQGPNGELAESGVAIVAFAEIELARVRRALDAFMQQRRPPPHIRPKVGSWVPHFGQSVEIFEIRPRWRGPPDEKARITGREGDLRQSTWRLARVLAATRPEVAPLRAKPEVKSVEEFAALVSDTTITALRIARSYCYESPEPTELGSIGGGQGPIGWKVEVTIGSSQTECVPRR
jgi:hypothetical protein